MLDENVKDGQPHPTPFVCDEWVRYPNQKRVIIRNNYFEDMKDLWKYNAREAYLKAKPAYQAIEKAAQALDAGSFKLYIYLSQCSTSCECSLNLSQVAVEREFGIKKNQYYRAIEKLIEVGYLYQPNPSINYYIFDVDGFD